MHGVTYKEPRAEATSPILPPFSPPHVFPSGIFLSNRPVCSQPGGLLKTIDYLPFCMSNQKENTGTHIYSHSHPYEWSKKQHLCTAYICNDVHALNQKHMPPPSLSSQLYFTTRPLTLKIGSPDVSRQTRHQDGFSSHIRVYIPVLKHHC